MNISGQHFESVHSTRISLVVNLSQIYVRVHYMYIWFSLVNVNIVMVVFLRILSIVGLLGLRQQQLKRCNVAVGIYKTAVIT